MILAVVGPTLECSAAGTQQTTGYEMLPPCEISESILSGRLVNAPKGKELDIGFCIRVAAASKFLVTLRNLLLQTLTTTDIRAD